MPNASKMKRQILMLIAFAFLSFECISQAQVTTFILVRHAEKLAGNMTDNKNDPDLTEEGKQRAGRLAALLRETKVDAIYSTNYKRTQNTVAPLAAAKGIVVRTYEAKKTEAIDEMLKNFPGGTIVVCGHSNTTPWVANYLLDKEELKDFEDSDYDNVLVVTVIERAKGKVVWMNY